MKEAESIVTDKERSELLENWTGGNAGELAKFLKAGDSAGFDRSLLQHMRSRKAPRFFFTEKEIAGRADWIRSRLPQGMKEVIEHADAVMKHKFPHDDGYASPYNVQLPESFTWLASPTSDPQTLCSLNRHRFWIELAMAYRFTGEERYIGELEKQIVSWCKEQGRPPFDQISEGKYQPRQPRWELLDTAIRGDTWIWTYFLVCATEPWTPEINTLFLHRLILHAMFLEKLTPSSGGGSNWLIMQAQGMLDIALLFPEFKKSSAWEKHALQCLGGCLNMQFRADGMHCEQSMDYHIGCICWFLEPFWLAKLNGRTSVEPEIKKLHQAAEAFYQLLHPDGTFPILSDADYVRSQGALAAVSFALDEPKWGRLDEISQRDVWIFGPMDKFHGADDVRPAAVGLKDSGYYVMRSGDGEDDCQLVFDCGPKGSWHGHSDLLSFELYGFKRALLCDPGRWMYDGSKERDWVVGTPAHNTISLDGVNHADLERTDDSRFKVDTWEVQDDHILVSAHHSGYAGLSGSPTVGRTIWYDRKNTFVILDWGTGQQEHDYTVSFTFPGKDASVIRDGRIFSQRSDGNVLVQNLELPGQSLLRNESFWSPIYAENEPAVRYTASQKGKQVLFGHIVMTYGGKESPAISACWDSPPIFGKAVKIKLLVGGKKHLIEFRPVQ